MLKNSHQGPSLKQWLISIRVNKKNDLKLNLTVKCDAKLFLQKLFKN